MNKSIPFPPGSLILPYLRDSGGREQDASVERQRAEISAWAATHQLIIPRWYFDPARSGRSTAGREQFLQLIEYLAAEKRAEAGIVFWDYARFARDFDDTMYYLAELRRRGYVAWSISDTIPDSLEGRVMEGLIAWKDAKYREDLSRNVRSGQHRLVSAFQVYPNRLAPMGLKKVPLTLPSHRDGTPHVVHQLAPDPETAPLILKAFTMRAEGATYPEIHNALRLTTWPESLHRILRNPIYIGTLKFGGKEYPNFCEPTVPLEIWEAAQKVNRARREKHGYNHPRAARSRFLLTGLIFCAECGSPMHGRIARHKNYRGYDYYRCRRNSGKARTCHAILIPKEELEGKILDTLEQAVLQPEILAPLLLQAQSNLSGRREKHTAELAHLERQARDTERDIQNVLKAIKEAGHSRALINELTRLEAQRDSIATSIASHSSAQPQPITISPQQLEQTLKVLTRKLRGKPSECTTVLRGLVVQIRAKRKSGGSHIANRSQPITIDITYRIPITNETQTISV